MNIGLVNQSIASNTELDVVLVGDSITEMWNGRMMSGIYGNYDDNARAFQQLFQKERGGKVEGLALGIAGDQVRALFRLKHFV